MALVCSCEKKIDIPEVDHEPRLVVLAELHKGGVEAYVSNSVARDAVVPDPISNAEVTLIDQDQNRNTLSYNSAAERYFNANIFPLPGNEYQLEISHPDFPFAKAKAIMPSQLKIDSMTAAFQGITLIPNNPDGELWNYELTVFLNEVSEQVAYLSLSLFSETKITTDSTSMIQPSFGTSLIGEGLETNGLNFGEYLLRTLDQEVATNRSFKIFASFFITQENMSPHKIGFTIQTVSTEKQQFINFIDNQSLFGSDIFILDPLEIQGNIENGYGLFEAFSSDQIEKLIE